ncbi:MAG: D-alanyl-D-alanine carboxypeptidase [Bradyrhizobiaceae bacterium]|nr:D-alanyl-D-alanine carboxypeptidase [Bradyrhizobiaceae bacterium]
MAAPLPPALNSPRFGYLTALVRSIMRPCAVLAVTLSLVVVAHAASNPSGGIQTSAPIALLMDAETGSVLLEKNPDQVMAPSGMAKLMTAEVVFNEIKEGRLKLDDEFNISEDTWRRGGAPSHTSSMFAAIHSRVRVEDLIRGMIIQTANDASLALAEGISGNELTFVQAMNKRASELGLTQSHFANATGLPDPREKMTARELAKLGQHIIQTYPDFYLIFAEKEFTWNKIRQQNRNPLLNLGLGADGMTIGFSVEGGYGLVGSVVQNGQRLILVMSGLRSAKEREEEARKLIEFGFRGFETRLLFAEGQIIGEARLFGGSSRNVPLIAPGVISLLVPRGATERILAKIVYTGPVPAPVTEGQPIGTLKVFRGENLSLEVPLKAAESVGTGSLSQRAFDAATELVIGLFRSGVSRL